MVCFVITNLPKVSDFTQENVSIILNYFFNSGENFNWCKVNKTNAIKLPSTAPATTSSRKWCPRYILDIPAIDAGMSQIVFCDDFVVKKASRLNKANAAVVCPDGKLLV